MVLHTQIACDPKYAPCGFPQLIILGCCIHIRRKMEGKTTAAISCYRVKTFLWEAIETYSLTGAMDKNQYYHKYQ